MDERSGGTDPRRKPNSSTAIFYNRTKAPWPASDRDAVLRAITTLDTQKNVVRIELEAIEHPAWPPQKGAVRMPKLRGHWYLWPEKGGEYTRAEYQVFANPGGSPPDWIINMVSKSIPHSTIVHLREQVKRRRYYEFERRSKPCPSTSRSCARPSPPRRPPLAAGPNRRAPRPVPDLTPTPSPLHM